MSKIIPFKSLGRFFAEKPMPPSPLSLPPIRCVKLWDGYTQRHYPILKDDAFLLLRLNIIIRDGKSLDKFQVRDGGLNRYEMSLYLEIIKKSKRMGAKL